MISDNRKNRSTALVATIGIHLGLVALFLFVMGFTAPNPPLGELGSGVELQLGVDDQGSGDVQQEIPVAPTTSKTETEDEAVQKSTAESEPNEEVKPVSEDHTKDNVTLEDKESPVIANEQKKEPKIIEAPKEKMVEKPADPAREKPVTGKIDVTKEVKQTISGTKDGPQNVKSSKGLSQGNDVGKIGDKGKPEGVPDLKAQYSGKPGAGGPGEGGAGGISVTGFDGFDRPDIVKPEIPEDSYGTYEFLVKVNSQGEIEKITTINRGIGLEAENIFKKLIQNLDFTPNKSNLPAFSEGTITFRVVPPRKK